MLLFTTGWFGSYSFVNLWPNMLHSGMNPASSCIEFLSLHCVTL
uniref:Uncharacterized protein n=1 Tax=Anguilla anguilla TaxID=7936 RepID=A0A0E9TET0_ANGAN